MDTFSTSGIISKILFNFYFIFYLATADNPIFKIPTYFCYLSLAPF